MRMQITADVVKKHEVVDLESRTGELVQFAKAVQKKIPGSFFVASRSSARYWLCLQGYPATLGCIFTETSTAADNYGKTLYSIESYRQVNIKGREFIKSSINLNTAVRNAAKFLTSRPYHEIAGNFESEIRSGRASILNPVEWELRDATTSLFGYNPEPDMVAEFTEMYTEGYTFKRARITEGFEVYQAAKRAYDDAKQDKPDGFDCVIGILDRARNLNKFAVIAMKTEGKSKLLNGIYSPDTDIHPQVCTPNALPEYIQDVIPMLEMVEEEEYINGVGVKVCEGLYFVERRDG